MKDEDVDLLLRRVLAPTSDAAIRVAKAALLEGAGVQTNKPFRVAIVAVAMTMLLVALALVLRPMSPPTARTASVYSVGELVVGVSPSGSCWIVGPGDHLDTPAVPRIVVVKGGSR